MNLAGKPHRNANVSASSVLRRSQVFRISKPFLSKFITAPKGAMAALAIRRSSCLAERDVRGGAVLILWLVWSVVEE
jgi:hypothetical protein